MQGTYDWWLVCCSYLVAVLASYVALELCARVAGSSKRAAWIWIAFGSTVMGLGIWSMHFVGMLAFHLPIRLAYDLPFTLLSMVPAVLSAALMLALVHQGNVAGRRLVLGAAVLGCGIAAMHYTGMAAARFAPDAVCSIAPGTMDQTWLAVIIAFNTLVILLGTLAIVHVDARYADQRAQTFDAVQAANAALAERTRRAEQAERATQENEARFRSLTELSSDWYWEQDENLRFTQMSGGVLERLGQKPQAYIGKSRWDFPIIVSDDALAAHKTVLEAREPFSNFVYARRHPDRGNAYVSISGVPLFDDAGKFRGYRGIGRDVTVQILADEALKGEERRLRLMVEHLPAGAAFVNGESLYLNPRVEQITGYKPSELSTLDQWFGALYPGRAEEIKGLYRADKVAGFTATRIVPIAHKDGTERLLEFAAFGDNSGEVWLINDVTERVDAEEKFRVLFEYSSDAHLLFDENGIMDCNNAALAMVGCTRKSQILGMHPAILSPDVQPDGRTSAEKSAAMDALARNQGYHRFEWVHRRLDGAAFPVEVTLTQINLGGRQVVLTVWHDQTESKRKEAEIIRAQEQLRLALVGSKLALFEWTVATGEVFLSERWAEMIGSEPGPTQTTIDALTQLVHPQDTDQVRVLIYDVIKGNSPYYEADHRFRTATGDYIWVQSHGKVAERDVYGKAVRVSGTNADITHRKQAEQALNEAYEKLGDGVNALEHRNREITLLAELSNFLISCVTVEEACNAIPKYCEKLFPGEQGALYLLCASGDLLNPYASWGGPRKETPSFTPQDCRALRHARAHAMFDPQQDAVCEHVAAHGDVQPYMCVPIVIQSDVLGLLWITLAATESASGAGAARMKDSQQLAVTLSEQIAMALSNIRLREDLRQQTIHDALTGLYNRRFLEDSINREISRCKRSDKSFGVLMLDIDHFKRVNDTFGHDAGDSVLRSVAQAVQEHIRDADIACRFGGEEFIIVLPDTGRGGAATLAERILTVVRNIRVTHNDKALGSITASIGLAMYPRNGATMKTIIQSADQVMYEAKGAGRDRLVVASE